MKISETAETAGKIFFVLFFVVPILIVVGILIFFVRPPTLSARESYQKASEILRTRDKEAVLINIWTGYIPLTIQGSASSYERGGRGDPWDICFYSEKEDEFIYFTNTGREQVQEKEENGICKTQHPSGVDTEGWKIDSEEAVRLAKDKAEELEKEKFVIVRIELRQEEERPIWELEFLPLEVGEKTTGLRITINAETGEVIKTEEPSHPYMSI